MATIDAVAFLPRWTKRVRTDGGGRDTLGLSRVTESITDHLLQGIITTTDRARYYSFYCWSLWHIQQTGPPRKFADFIREFRRLVRNRLAFDRRKSPRLISALMAKSAPAHRSAEP